jgi:hypothetical protein
MIKLNNIGISIEMGVIPSFYRLPFKLNDAGVSVDMGAIPPKNYFRFKMSTLGVTVDHQIARGEIKYQVI